MLDIDQFLAECRDARAEAEPRRPMREVLARAVAAPDEVAAALRPTEGGINVLHNTADLTVLNVVWAPGMRIYPHDHRMWAAIGIYAGREDNTFYRRSGRGPSSGSGSGSQSRTLTASGGRTLTVGDVVVLGDDTIHAVANPGTTLTGAIHIYGGDLINEPRSQWGPGSLEERPYDLDQARRQFVQANHAWQATALTRG